jgi:hypothetical protein
MPFSPAVPIYRYMAAALRLAALIAMIRKCVPKDTDNIVARSRGCLLSLLAQAFLMEKGDRTADVQVEDDSDKSPAFAGPDTARRCRASRQMPIAPAEYTACFD